LKDTVAKGVKDAYNGLITVIKDRYQKHQNVTDCVDHLTKKPQDKNRREALEDELKKAGGEIDNRLLEASQAVIEAVEKHSPETARAIGMDIGEFKAAALHIKNLQSPKEGIGFRADKVDIAGTATFDNIGGSPTPKE
jgi:hypothetical protein